MPTYPAGAPDFLDYRYCPQCAAELSTATDPADGRERPTCPGCGWVHHAHSPIGVIAVIEAPDGLVFTRPAGAPEGTVGLCALFIEYGENPEDGIVRAVREQTGLDVEVLDEIARFQQEGTPFGQAVILGLRTRVTGGTLHDHGRLGPAELHPHGALPEIIPTRLAMRRVHAAYLARHAAV